MTTPVIAGTADTPFSTGTTSGSVSLPASISSGDALLIFGCADGTTTFGVPAGWTILDQRSDSTLMTGLVAYRDADGTEGATITVTSSTSTKLVFRAYRITGADFGTTIPEFTAADSGGGGSTNPDSPTITPAGGSDDYLYFSVAPFDTDGPSVSTYPSGYTGTGINISGTAGSQCSIAWAVSSTTSSTTENPGAYTISASRRWVGYTIAITPTSSGGSAALTGTTVSTITEDDVVTGGKTSIITLTGDTWAAAGTGPIGSTADTQAIIDGFDAASSPTNGWNNEVRDNEVTTAVVRTSSTVATITWTAAASYDITSTETITCTVPNAALVTGTSDIISTPTFTVTAVASGRLMSSLANAGGLAGFGGIAGRGGGLAG